MDEIKNIGPFIAPHTVVGPKIDAPGWTQSYSSPYVQPHYPPDWYTGPNQVDMTRGRHQFRTQPRPLGPAGLISRVRAGHGMGGLSVENQKWAALAAGGAAGVAASYVLRKKKTFDIWTLIGAGVGAVVAKQFVLPVITPGIDAG